jgi:hypothetical protein
MTYATDNMDCGLSAEPQRGTACGRNKQEKGEMFDLICIAIIGLFFVVGAAFARGCERLETEE